MFEAFIDSFSQYFGADWLALGFGLYGMHLLTRRNSAGFVFSALACVCGFWVALVSGQFGFVVYNVLLICVSARGFMTWKEPEQQNSRPASFQLRTDP